jgi:hypothetical protein
VGWRLQIERSEIPRKGCGKIRAAQRKIDDRTQETELVARIVPDACEFVRINWSMGYQTPKRIGQLDLSRLITRGGRE